MVCCFKRQHYDLASQAPQYDAEGNLCLPISDMDGNETSGRRELVTESNTLQS
jgi:hypothetical protein